MALTATWIVTFSTPQGLRDPERDWGAVQGLPAIASKAMHDYPLGETPYLLV
jgi:hypothetical protein